MADTLDGIRRFFGVSLDQIYVLNRTVKSNGIRPGQKLKLPNPPR